ncbi:MAG TPA: hypothetical protein PLN63_07045 [Paludibacteraceae bacterium]|nr:hypothetical protein [Paludibacteraceae bacterium]HOU68598.1 hypothetical protein [Paludibacteraceae bacterium]HPH63358.1 hypothetical protein [Paludibacteraceae bacterium]
MEHTSIERKDAGESFYEKLQKDSVSLLQKLSGDVWTDYNLHDPGVTILEQLNYALWELDYRMRFNLQDYLTPPNEQFDPSKSLLFSPVDVFAVSPVTPTDYRLLIVSSVDDVADVKVLVNRETCTYDFVVDVFSDTSDQRKQLIIDDIVKLFHQHRNLCENLGNVTFSSQIILDFHADVEIALDSNPEQMLAQIYYSAQSFLNSGVTFVSLRSQKEEGHTYDEMFDGPEQKKMLIEQDTLSEQGDVLSISDLYNRLSKVEGVSSVISLYFQKGNLRFVNKLRLPDLYHSYSIVAFGAGDLHVRLLRNGKTVDVSTQEVKRLIQNYRYTEQTSSDSSSVDNIKWNFPEGNNPGIFAHEPVGNGMPDCYGVNERGIAPSYTSTERDLQIAQLKTYMSWFDSIFESGLLELNTIGDRMNGKVDFNESWADMLDGIYGEHSSLSHLDRHCMEKKNARLDFLQNVSSYAKNRGMGMNLLDSSPGSVSGLEFYLKQLIGIKEDCFNFFLIEHPLFYYGASTEIPEEEKMTVSALFFVEERLQNDTQFCDFCSLMLKKRIPAHITLAHVCWWPISNLESFQTDYNFWKYILSTQKKLGGAQLAGKMKKWISSVE